MAFTAPAGVRKILKPVFRRLSDGRLDLKNSPLCDAVIRTNGTKAYRPPQPPKQVKELAVETVTKRQGDPGNEIDYLGEFSIQFGKYQGQSFRWLLENALGYVSWLVVEMEKEVPTANPSNRTANKRALKKYISLFPEGQEALNMKRKESGRKTDTPMDIQSDMELVECLEDMELVSCLQEYELAEQLAPKLPSPGKGNVATASTVKQSFLQEREMTPAPKEQFSATVQQPSASLDTVFQESDMTLAPAEKSTATLKQPSVIADDQFPCFCGKVFISLTHLIQHKSNVHQREDSRHAASATVVAPDERSTTSSQVTVETTKLSAHSDDTTSLLVGWKLTLPEVDHHWVSNTFFIDGKRGPVFDFTRVSKLWYHPPQPSLSGGILNKVDRYFGHRMFLWMPRHLYHVQLHCPHTGCLGTLTNAGVHQKTRVVLDVDSYYNIAAEYLSCSTCKRKVISWSQGVLDQLDNNLRSLFPCIMTSHYACDVKVVRLLRQRSLGNSSSAVCKQVEEEHGETYLLKMQQYLTHCQYFKKSAARGFFSSQTFKDPPPQIPVPKHRWFMKIYQLDVIERIDYIKACITSTFGSVLKMDSTKKVTKKLAGRGRKTAMWATNVGNEHGQVLMSVLTEGEGVGLKRMIDGLVSRYKDASVPPPKVLYVDRDCCGTASLSKYFSGWPFLNLRLDIWHFMRRFPYGCTTDKHQLYATLMSKLSSCIFKWDEEDIALLMKAKRAEMIQQSIPNPDDKDVLRNIKTEELSLHCRRATRGVKQTTDLIGDLIRSLDGSKGCDTLGVPLFDSVKMAEVWQQQSRHVPCIQDPQGVRLYTQTGTLKKGGVTLPVYRCARGSTSLESFHLHMNRFIPGTLASDINFQVFLLDGVFRWNEDRRLSAVERSSDSTPAIKTYSGPLKNAVNKLSIDVLGKTVFADYNPPGKYTGVETTTIHPEVAQEGDQEKDESVGPDNIPGYSRVLALADFLVSLRELAVMAPQHVQTLLGLWNALHDFDKKRTSFPARFSRQSLSGRFKSHRKKVAPGVETIERVILGPNSGPAQWPNCNRYVEATVEKLLKLFPSDQRREGKTTTRWFLVLGAYHNIRTTVLKTPQIMEGTEIQLPQLNKKTLQQWFNEKSKREDRQVLLQGLNMPQPSMTAKGFIPKALGKPSSLQSGNTPPFEYHDPPSTVGLAKLKKRPSKMTQVPAATLPASTSAILPPRLILPNPSSTIIRFPVVITPSAIQPSIYGQARLSPQQGLKRKGEVEFGHQKRKMVRCGKCNDPREPPNHLQYMGYRYCSKTDNIPFEQWRANLQSLGVARKKKD